MTAQPKHHSVVVRAEQLRSQIATLEHTIAQVRKSPPPGVRPEFVKLDLKSFVRERDALSAKLDALTAGEDVPYGGRAGTGTSAS